MKESVKRTQINEIIIALKKQALKQDFLLQREEDFVYKWIEEQKIKLNGNLIVNEKFTLFFEIISDETTKSGTIEMFMLRVKDSIKQKTKLKGKEDFKNIEEIVKLVGSNIEMAKLKEMYESCGWCYLETLTQKIENAAKDLAWAYNRQLLMEHILEKSQVQTFQELELESASFFVVTSFGGQEEAIKIRKYYSNKEILLFEKDLN